MEIEVPPEIKTEPLEFHNPFVVTKSCSDAKGIQPFQRCFETILKQQNGRPSLFATKRAKTKRWKEINDYIHSPEKKIILTPEDSHDLAIILMDFLEQVQLVPNFLHVVCQGILALNQAAGSRKCDGGAIKLPNGLIRSLVKSMLILLPTALLKRLQSLISFSCQVCGLVSTKTKNSWAHQLSLAFGPIVINGHTTKPSKKGFDKTEFASSFFELLMHCHGIHAEAHTKGVREIWCVSDQMMKEIKRRLIAIRTPSRHLTPRKCSSARKVLTGCARRNLFKAFSDKGD